MTIRIELPDGGQYIEVKDVSELSSGDRRAVSAATPLTIDPETQQATLPGDYNDRMHNALAARIITGWNLQWPLPKGDPRVLDNLTMAQADALFDGIEPHVQAINESRANPRERGSDPTAG